MKIPEYIDEIKGVVFDFGGVISVSALGDEALYDFCGKLGINRGAVDAGWHRYRMLWDGGVVDFASMWERIFADNGKTLSEDTVRELWELDACAWIRTLREDTLRLMAEFKAAGKKIGLLTNMSADFYERLYVPKAGKYRELTDVEVVSGKVGMVKPLRCIYEYTQRLMDLPGEQLLFFDDFAINVEMARKCGWRSELYSPA